MKFHEGQSYCSNNITEVEAMIGMVLQFLPNRGFYVPTPMIIKLYRSSVALFHLKFVFECRI